MSLPKAQDAAKAFYVWKHYNPTAVETCDVLAIWSAGYHAGGQAMLLRSANWQGLEPVLADLLEALVTDRVRREAEGLDEGRT